MSVQKKEGCLVGGPEGLLGGIHHVEEPVIIPLLFIHLRDGSRHGHHTVTVDQEEEGLVGIKLEAPPGGQTTHNKAELRKERKRRKENMEPVCQAPRCASRSTTQET